MRDPNRINRIINLLRAYWLSHPDLRLGQILGNATPRISTPNLSGQVSSSPGDPYYFEDDKFEAWLRKQLDPLTQIAADAAAPPPPTMESEKL